MRDSWDKGLLHLKTEISLMSVSYFQLSPFSHHIRLFGTQTWRHKVTCPPSPDRDMSPLPSPPFVISCLFSSRFRTHARAPISAPVRVCSGFSGDVRAHYPECLVCCRRAEGWLCRFSLGSCRYYALFFQNIRNWGKENKRGRWDLSLPTPQRCLSSRRTRLTKMLVSWCGWRLF